MYKVIACNVMDSIDYPMIEMLVPENGVLTQDDVTNFFKEHPQATRVKIPEGVERLGEALFEFCQKLEFFVDLPRVLREIKRELFRGCVSLKAIKIPEGVEILGEHSFFECFQLEHVELPGTLLRIGEGVFDSCGSLRAIKIPDGVEFLEECAFGGCEQLEHVELPSSLREIGGGVFTYCKSLKSVKIPDGVERLEDAAFNMCEQLEHVELPSSIRQVENCAFYRCKSLKVVKIPEGVASLGGEAFMQCGQLIAAYVHQDVQLGDDVFAGVSADFVRYTEIEKYHAHPVVADVYHRRDELNNRPIVRLTREPYFRLSNIEMGVEVFPGSRDALFWVALNVMNFGDDGIPSVVIIEIFKNFKWSDLEYDLGRYACLNNI